MANNDISVKPSLQQAQLQTSQSPSVAQANTLKANESEKTSFVENMYEKQQLLKEKSKNDSAEALQEKVAQLNDHMQNLSRQLHFQVDENSGDTFVQVIDSETDKVVRQIPSQDVIDVRNAIEKYKGILLKEKA
jgi:flagellar protein FlaG